MSVASENLLDLENVPADRELVFERLLDAPRELVWKVWTDPAHVAQWWGPTGFSNAIKSMEVRPGGTWRFMMHGADGTDYPNLIEYLEVKKPERLVYLHSNDGHVPDHRFHMVVTFTPEGGKTRLKMRMIHATAAECAAVGQFATEGGRQTLQRLADYLMIDAPDAFIITRELDAPRELVWKVWSEPAHLAKWFGPKGSTVLMSEMDLRPGGTYRFGLRGPGGDMYARWTFRDVVPGERLTTINEFTDAGGKAIPAPFAEAWPVKMISTVYFEAIGPARTRVTVRWAPFEATAAEAKVFADNKGSMNQGWTGTFEKLEAYLRSSPG